MNSLSPKLFFLIGDMGDYSDMFDLTPALRRNIILEGLTTENAKNDLATQNHQLHSWFNANNNTSICSQKHPSSLFIINKTIPRTSFCFILYFQCYHPFFSKTLNQSYLLTSAIFFQTYKTPINSILCDYILCLCIVSIDVKGHQNILYKKRETHK